MTFNKSNYSSDRSDVSYPEKTPLTKSIVDDENYSSVETIDNPNEIIKIALLEEKLQVIRGKQKVGEVVIRKAIETRMIQVPIQQEKLIIERVGKNPEKLTEVLIKEEIVNGFNYEELNKTDTLHITKSHYLDPHTAKKLLESIDRLDSVNQTKIRLEIVSTKSEHQIEHQGICDRFKP